MNISILSQFDEKAADLIIAFPKNKKDNDLVRKYTDLYNEDDFTAEAKETIYLYQKNGVNKILLLGLGEIKDQPRSAAYFRSCIFQNKKKLNKTLAVLVSHLDDYHVFNAVNGVLIGLKKNGVFKQEKEKSQVENLIFITDQKNHHKVIEDARQYTETQLELMHLVDMPSNIKTPEYIGQMVLDSARQYGYKAEVLDKTQLEKQGLKALLSVGQGSVNPPVLIVAEYKPDVPDGTLKTIGLVGKGISFDTGGISIKPSANMGYMKSDMGGAAAVIGAIELAAKLKLNAHIIAIIPSAENSVDALSIRPGDIIGSYSGKSIEVIDTDAEGRLILADGLAYLLKNYKPEYIVDVATLTGSIIQTLGYHAAGLFTQNDELAKLMSEAGESVFERVWRLPVWDDYMGDMQSDMADIKNLSGKPVAGAITAAKFVEYFTENHENWAHLDIAGVAFADSEFTKQRAATGFGIRLLFEFIKKLQ
jgi:leucyl aminopeptidase